VLVVRCVTAVNCVRMITAHFLAARATAPPPVKRTDAWSAHAMLGVLGLLGLLGLFELLG
jgi:hypothetical protein